MNNNFIKTAVIAAIAGAWAMPAFAQGFTSSAFELLKERRLWFHSANAAGTVFDNRTNYSELTIGYDYIGGNFKRPQQGKTTTDIKVNCEGFMDLKTAYVWGEFSFDHRNEDEAGYNASITDPFRGMPYYIVDTHQSDWRNQYYDMRFRAATPLYWNKVAFGVEGVYRASISAKQRDPRVDTRFFDLQVIPGVAWEFLPGQRVGANFQYEAIKEDSQMELAYAQGYQDYYVMYGLGVAVFNHGSGRDTNYHGHRFGGGLQYNYSADGIDLMVEGNYSRKVENVDAGYSSPRKDASVDEHLLTLGVNAQFTGEHLSHFVKAGYYNRDIKGIQYLSEYDNSGNFNGWMDIFRSVRSKYKTRIADAEYSIMRNRADEYVWRVDAGVKYTKLDDRYLLPECLKNSENLYMHLDAKYNFVIGRELRRRLLVNIGGGYNANLSGKYTYTAPNPEYLTVTEVETGDENYLTSKWYNVGASATYSQQISRTQKMNAFAKAEFNYVKTSSYNFNHRSYMAVTIGVNF